MSGTGLFTSALASTPMPILTLEITTESTSALYEEPAGRSRVSAEMETPYRPVSLMLAALLEGSFGSVRSIRRLLFKTTTPPSLAFWIWPPCSHTARLGPLTFLAEIPALPTPLIVESTTWMEPLSEVMPLPRTFVMVDLPATSAELLVAVPVRAMPSPVASEIREPLSIWKRALVPDTTTPFPLTWLTRDSLSETVAEGPLTEMAVLPVFVIVTEIPKCLRRIRKPPERTEWSP